MLYIGLVFFEPAHLHASEMDEPETFELYKNRIDYVVEILVIVYFSINFLLEIAMIISMYKYSSAVIHKNEKSCFKKFVNIIFKENLLSTSTLIMDFVLITDFICYVALYPYGFFRFTRLLRPCTDL